MAYARKQNADQLSPLAEFAGQVNLICRRLHLGVARRTDLFHRSQQWNCRSVQCADELLVSAALPLVAKRSRTVKRTMQMPLQTPTNAVETTVPNPARITTGHGPVTQFAQIDVESTGKKQEG